jgi:acyl carrier protein
MESREQEIRQFIVDNFLFGQKDAKLSSDDSFLDKGIIDSTGVLELVSHLEKAYRIKVDDADLVPANLDSLRNIVKFLDRKLGTTAVAAAGAATAAAVRASP